VKNFLNPYLQHYKYQYHLPIEAPFNNAILDFHITQQPDIYNGYLRLAATGEVFSADGRHCPDPVAPLPVVSPSVWGAKMVSLEIGPSPFDTSIWTFYTQKLLTYTAHKSQLPSAIQGILNTSFYKILMPKLYAAYPDSEMQVVLAAASQPKFDELQGLIHANTNLSLTFQVVGKGAPALAFEMWSPFQVTMHVSMKGNYIVGGLDNVTVTLYPGDCPFGIVGPDIISALSIPVNQLINILVIPILDAFVSRGVLLPTFNTTLGSVAIIYGNFVNPQLLLNAGYMLIATDVNITIVEKKTGRPFPQPSVALDYE